MRFRENLRPLRDPKIKRAIAASRKKWEAAQKKLWEDSQAKPVQDGGGNDGSLPSKSTDSNQPK